MASPSKANDLTFGADGRLYFTDPADYLPNDRKPGRVFALNPDGSGECLKELPSAYPNGIVAEPDGSIVWVESYDRGVYRKRLGRPSEQIHQLPDGHIPDGLKIDADGNLWVTTFMSGGVDILRQTARRSTSSKPGACRSTACSTLAI